MSALSRVCVAAAVATLGSAAHAESLRCNGAIAAEGDSRLAVLYKCGQPVLADSYCAPVFYIGAAQPVPEPFASAIVPCQQVDEWLYDRGAGNLMATVRFRSGAVASITYGRLPR
ncbi:DUF2845 domain-containing protein [Piscinibacter sp.]|jgi:hypothetical protein|uniref:DUF2845 domain-containing protein n=1 Tax=Piscinibacter sp. TaxID=1903157 RepID=UPI003559B207